MFIIPVRGSDPRVAHVYEHVGYANPIASEETVLLACGHRDTLGAVRLVVEDGVFVLRGMQVKPRHRRRGVGRQLLQTALALCGTEACYCIAHSGVRTWYTRAGFTEIAPEQAPPHLQERLRQSDVADRCIMRRSLR